jgi:hypothetical protein
MDINVFEIVKSVFGKQNVGTLYTNGEPEMLCNTCSFSALVKREAPHVIVHSLLSISACIGVKGSAKSPERSFVFNFIRARALNDRLFKMFCK